MRSKTWYCKYILFIQVSVYYIVIVLNSKEIIKILPGNIFLLLQQLKGIVHPKIKMLSSFTPP